MTTHGKVSVIHNLQHTAPCRLSFKDELTFLRWMSQNRQTGRQFLIYTTLALHEFSLRSYTQLVIGTQHTRTRTMCMTYCKGTETENHCKLLCLYCSLAARFPWGCGNWLVQSLLSTRYSFSASSVQCLPEGPRCYAKNIAEQSHTAHHGLQFHFPKCPLLLLKMMNI